MSICSTAFSEEARQNIKPLAVSVKTACRLLGVGNTMMWQLIKNGHVQTISIGRRRLVIYASLESLLSASPASEPQPQHGGQVPKVHPIVGTAS